MKKILLGFILGILFLKVIHSSDVYFYYKYRRQCILLNKDYSSKIIEPCVKNKLGVLQYLSIFSINYNPT